MTKFKNLNKFDYSIINEKHKQYWSHDDTPLFVMLLFVIFIFVAHLLPTYIYIPVNIIGPSMQPSLYEGDKVILLRQGKINYGEIVVLHAPNLVNIHGEGEDIIKRVTGLPGDTIWFEKKTVGGKETYFMHREHVVNGMTVQTVISNEYYVKKDHLGNALGSYDLSKKWVLGEDEYFVMGDNRANSTDSRATEVGVVKREQIIGKALFIIREGKISLFKKIIY